LPPAPPGLVHNPSPCIASTIVLQFIGSFDLARTATAASIWLIFLFAGFDSLAAGFATVAFFLVATDEHDQPAIVTEPYEKTFTAANVKKEQEFHESDLTFRVQLKAKGKEKTVEFTVKAKDNAAKQFKEYAIFIRFCLPILTAESLRDT